MRFSRIQSAKLFLNWMEQRYPGSRQKILNLAPIPVDKGELSHLGQMSPMSFPGVFNPSVPTPTVPFPNVVAMPTTTPSPQKAWWEKLADAASQVVPAYFQYKTQDKITDAQIERMKQGYAPIENPTSYMPAFRVQHEVDVPRSIGVTEETKNLLYIGGAMIGGLFLLNYMQNDNGK